MKRSCVIESASTFILAASFNGAIVLVTHDEENVRMVEPLHV